MTRAFTLIELLVVVTIIVVLLALLSPALDKAVYQAQLAVCAAQQNATAKGLNVYAMDFKRSYPFRQVAAVSSLVYPWQLNVGAQGGGTVAAASDDRVPLKGYVDLALLVDPLCQRVRLDDPDAWVYSSYALWYGWRYVGHEGMTRVGNRLTWTDPTSTPAKTYSVNWLVTDLDGVTPDGPYNQGSHPDDFGLLHNTAIERGGHSNPNPAVQANNELGKVSISMWVSWNGWDRGEIEMNAASADGAVTRFDDVDTCEDNRMGRAGPSPDGNMGTVANRTRRDGTTASTPGSWINIPLP